MKVLKRSGIDPELISDVIMGDCIQCPDEANTARTAMLKAGLPHEIPAVTIQRQCSSAMQAVGLRVPTDNRRATPRLFFAAG